MGDALNEERLDLYPVEREIKPLKLWGKPIPGLLNPAWRLGFNLGNLTLQDIEKEHDQAEGGGDPECNGQQSAYAACAPEALEAIGDGLENVGDDQGR